VKNGKVFMVVKNTIKQLFGENYDKIDQKCFDFLDIKN